MGEIKAASTVLRFFLSHFLFLFLVLKKGSNIHNGFPVSKIKGKIDLIMNRAWRDLEKIRGAMPLTAGSTLFLPFKSGAKVRPEQSPTPVGQRRLSSLPIGWRVTPACWDSSSRMKTHNPPTAHTVSEY